MTWVSYAAGKISRWWHPVKNIESMVFIHRLPDVAFPDWMVWVDTVIILGRLNLMQRLLMEKSIKSLLNAARPAVPHGKLLYV